MTTPTPEPHRLLHQDLTNKILGAAIEVHRILGPGLLESRYETCLCHELRLRGLKCQSQVPLPVEYKGIIMPLGYRIDVLVEDLVIVENKSVETLHRIDEAQLVTQLRHSGKRVGLLINFNVPRLKDGIVRRVL